MNYTKIIKLDQTHPYPIARKALNSAMGTTIGLALIGGFCCTFLSCFGILFAKKVSLPVRILKLNAILEVFELILSLVEGTIVARLGAHASSHVKLSLKICFC